MNTLFLSKYNQNVLNWKWKLGWQLKADFDFDVASEIASYAWHTFEWINSSIYLYGRTAEGLSHHFLRATLKTRDHGNQWQAYLPRNLQNLTTNMMNLLSFLKCYEIFMKLSG